MKTLFTNQSTFNISNIENNSVIMNSSPSTTDYNNRVEVLPKNLSLALKDIKETKNLENIELGHRNESRWKTQSRDNFEMYQATEIVNYLSILLEMK